MSLYLLRSLFLAVGLVCQPFDLDDILEKNYADKDPLASNPFAADLAVSDLFASDFPSDIIAEVPMGSNCIFGTVCQPFPLVLEYR